MSYVMEQTIFFNKCIIFDKGFAHKLYHIKTFKFFFIKWTNVLISCKDLIK